MKRRVVAGLVRLYPSRWRAEYGEELAEILLRRPLGFATVVNVVSGALRQHEPWLIVGVPLFVCVSVNWVMRLSGWQYRDPLSAFSVGGLLALVLLLFTGLGFWTVLRSGRGGACAAMSVLILLMAPAVVGGFLGYTHNGRLGPLSLCLVYLPFAGLLGWAGGLAGRLARRLAR